MIRQNIKNSLIVLIALAGLSACSNKDGRRCPIGEVCPDDTISTIQAGAETQAPICSVTVDKAVSPSGETRTLTFNISGGEAPYSIPGLRSGISSTATVTGAFINNTASNISLYKTVTVVDSNNRAGTCSFNIQVQPSGQGTGTGGLGCTAAIDASTTAPNVDRKVTITATGGTAPYSYLNGSAYSAFNQGSKAELIGKYLNSGSANVTLTKVVAIKDSAGNNATCSFGVTVLPDSATLKCKLSTVQSKIYPGINIDFIAEASGGTGPYTFSAFHPGIGADITPTVDANNSAKVTMTKVYPVLSNYAIKFQPWLQVTDSSSGTAQSVQCNLQAITGSKDLNLVAPPPPPTITIYGGSTTASITSTVRMTAIPTFFAAGFVPQITAVSNDPSVGVSVSLVSADGTSYIDVKPSNPEVDTDRNPEITITALAGNGETATVKVTLNFRSTNMPCEFKVEGGFAQGDLVSISATSTKATDVKVSWFDLGDGAYNVSAVPNNFVSTLTVRYNTLGNKVLRLRGYSPTRKTYCNDNVAVEKPILIGTRLTGCSIKSSQSLTALGEPVTFTAVPNANAGIGPFGIELKVFDKVVSGPVLGAPNTTKVGGPIGLSQALKFNYIGSFDVQMWITDFSGARFQCGSLEHRVIGNPGINTKAWKLDDDFKHLSTSWNPHQLGIDHVKYVLREHWLTSDINVSDRYYKDGFPGISEVKDFGVSFWGSINITAPGCYRFSVGSDDGHVFLLDGQVLTHMSKETPFQTRFSDTKCYGWNDVGLHPFVLKYFQGPRTRLGVVLSWQRPHDSGFAPIPASAFFREFDTYLPPSPGGWIQASGQECSSACNSIGKLNSISPEGMSCASGENRPAYSGASISYSYGIWGGLLEAGDSYSVGNRCYRSSQKHDGDATDLTVACYCR